LVSPLLLSFGRVAVGDSLALPVHLSNLGTLDITISDVDCPPDYEVGANPAPSRVFFIEGKNCYLFLEKLLQAFNVPPLLAPALPAILAMHIKDKIHGSRFLQHANE
jgi:hypothetical protein